MKEQFTKPLIEVVVINSDEIITTSKYGENPDSDIPLDDDDGNW